LHKKAAIYFYRIGYRKKMYNTLDKPQADVDTWIMVYDEETTGNERHCSEKTPMQMLTDPKPLVKTPLNNTW